MTAILSINGATLEADPSGALWWPDRATLIVADLHFEKGSSYAPSGRLLPPYDTAETLNRLSAVIARRTPARIVCLGDSLHDRDSVARIGPADRARIAELVGRHDWIWIEGNHDPAPHGLGGRVLAEWTEGPLTFRHEARCDLPIRPVTRLANGGRRERHDWTLERRSGGGHPDEIGIRRDAGSSLRDRSDERLPIRVARKSARPAPVAGEISGHFHPCARMSWRGRSVGGRCFVHDGMRLVMPAFGAYTGGLDVGDPAIRLLFPRGFAIDLIGQIGRAHV